MQMKRTRTFLNGVVVLSELSHIFCCVLPTVFSIMGILVGLGVAGAMPLWLGGLHDMIHEWEIPVIIMSGFVLILGWTVHNISERMDCHDTGCHHPPCGPQKKNSVLILRIATLLFAINISVFLIFHKGLNRIGLISETVQNVEQSHHEDHDHDGHDH